MSPVYLSPIVTRARGELDLLDADAVAQFFATGKPDYVPLAEAKGEVRL